MRLAMVEDTLFENKYRLGELLGEGGMGVVHAAINVFSDADVAIKRIPKVIAERHALGQRLRRESKVLALVIHPNIVRLLDCGVTEEGDVYIVMERVDGEPLRALMRRAAKKGETLDVGLVLHALVQVAEAMDLAHRKGIYHRDLKPENIMVCEGGHAKVLDFGLAKTSSTGRPKAPPVTLASPTAPTNPANIVGTAKYMAPEQVRGLAVDGRTDIYALGVVLYEAVSGHTPFASEEDEASTMTEILGHHVFAEPRPLRELVPGCPIEVWNLVVRCLAKKPEDRFASMSELVRELRRCEESEVKRRAASVERKRPREIRATEPMPESFRPVEHVLPFAAPAERTEGEAGFARTTAALRELRVTEPMPAPRAGRAAMPSAGLGKGHTMRMMARGPLAPGAGTPHDTQDIPRHGREGVTRSGAGFASESTWPGAQKRRAAVQTRVPTAARSAAASPAAASPAASPAASAKTRRSKAAASLWFTLPGGFALATFGLVATMIARSPRYQVERRDGAPVGEEPARGAEMPEPLAWSAAGVALPAKKARVTQSASPPAPPSRFVPLLSKASDKAAGLPRRAPGVTK